MTRGTEVSLPMNHIRVLLRRAGVRRTTSISNRMMVNVIEGFIVQLLELAIVYRDYAKRKTLMPLDVVYGYKKFGKQYYGVDASGRKSAKNYPDIPPGSIPTGKGKGKGKGKGAKGRAPSKGKKKRTRADLAALRSIRSARKNSMKPVFARQRFRRFVLNAIKQYMSAI